MTEQEFEQKIVDSVMELIRDYGPDGFNLANIRNSLNRELEILIKDMREATKRAEHEEWVDEGI